MNNALEISHLTKDYGSFKLDDVSFTVPGGTIMGLIGENGAGKSTTIKCILNLVRRDSGTITVLGMDNLTEERAVKEQIGVVLDEVLFHDMLRPRQVGKTESILHFAAENYKSVIYINFIEEPKYKLITENGYKPDEMIRNISRIDPSKHFEPGETLLFFDELQESR